ncbi:MAG: hypothetical protein FJ387_18665 [Verrucomicrobia bacterium]|nr:hypothetical protein [Verrucomicrobiota bacterium]
MTQSARVTSIAALDTFRSQLLVYLEKATLAVDDVRDDLVRTRLWLQHDQRVHWEAELRRRTHQLELAQQELFSAQQPSSFRTAPTAQQRAVAQAKRRVAEASDKLDRLKLWTRRYEIEGAPLAKELDRLRGLLTQELRQATALLTRSSLSLEAYADRAQPAPAPAPPTPHEPPL